MTQNPLISVIISTYNRYELLLQAIQSVKNQTYSPIEIIVINDNSSDPRYQQTITGITLHVSGACPYPLIAYPDIEYLDKTCTSPANLVGAFKL